MSVNESEIDDKEASKTHVGIFDAKVGEFVEPMALLSCGLGHFYSQADEHGEVSYCDMPTGTFMMRLGWEGYKRIE